MIQSLMADIMFYYSAAILPATISFQQLSPSPICDAVSKTELTKLDEIYVATTENVSFAKDNAKREFERGLDTDTYSIADEVFENLEVPVLTLNPFYFVDYKDVNSTTYNYLRAALDTGNVALYGSNKTWTYQEEESENENGTKTVTLKDDGGEYSTDDNGVNTLSTESKSVFVFKTVRAIDSSEIDSIFRPDILLSLEAGDTAQLIVTRSPENRYWWNNKSGDGNTYASLEEYITSYEYSSATENLEQGVLYHAHEKKTIIFAAGSTGLSGTLVEVAFKGNVLLTNNAGTWSIETITDDGDTDYDVISLKPILCGYEPMFYKLDDEDHMILGNFDEVEGRIGAEIVFSESLKDKLKVFFIDHAILDVDPETDNGDNGWK